MIAIKETLNTIFDEIIKDEKIMNLMGLPTVYKKDSDEIRLKKINHIIKRAITFSAQNPNALGKKFEKVTIEDKDYEDYGRIRMTICNMQSQDIDDLLFGKLKVEIDIYHLNSDTDKALEILNRITSKFSGKKIDIEWKDEYENAHISRRELTFRGIITQIPNINSYEKSGVRFSFYAPVYSEY